MKHVKPETSEHNPFSLKPSARSGFFSKFQGLQVRLRQPALALPWAPWLRQAGACHACHLHGCHLHEVRREALRKWTAVAGIGSRSNPSTSILDAVWLGYGRMSYVSLLEKILFDLVFILVGTEN